MIRLNMDLLHKYNNSFPYLIDGAYTKKHVTKQHSQLAYLQNRKESIDIIG